MEVVAPHEAEDCAHAGHGWQAVQGVGVRGLGGGEDGELDVAPPRGLVPAKGEVACAPFWPRWLGQALCHAISIGLLGELLPNRWPVVLAVGVLSVCQEVAPVVRQMPTAPQEVTGRPHRGGRDISFGEQATTEPDGKLGRGDLGIFGLAALEGFPGEGMAKATRDAFVSTEVGQPVPGEQTCDGDDETVALGGNDLQKGLRGCLPVAVQPDGALLVEEADIHSLRVQVDAAGKGVLGGVKSPEVSSIVVNLFSHDEQTTVVC